MERTLARPAGASPLLAREQTDAAFFDDIDLLRLLGGDFRRVTTVLAGVEGTSALQATITLGGDEAREATWTVAAGDATAWRLTLLGSRGTAVLSGRTEGPIELTLQDRRIEVAAVDPVERCVRLFLQRCSDAASAEGFDPLAPRWDDYVRAYDLLEAANRSIRRRRTIDLQFESTSERSQFKTQMATIGCGVLVWTMLGVFAGLALGKFLDPREPLERRASAAGTVLWGSDFPDGVADPDREALRRVLAGVDRDGKSGIVLIEASEGPPGASLDDQRKQAVTAAIAHDRNPDQVPQVDVRPLHGEWFRRVMLGVWGVVFAPLGIFLVLQLLISVTRGRR
jgi:hypothetical protein